MNSTSPVLNMEHLPDDPALNLKSVLVPEHVVPRLLAAGSDIELKPKDLKIRYIRYSRGTGCIVAYEHTTRSECGLPWLAYARVYSADVYEKTRRRVLKKCSASGSESVYTWDDLNTLVHIFPGDAKLSMASFWQFGLPDVLQTDPVGPGHESHRLRNSKVVRWKPESRCLLRVPVQRTRSGVNESVESVCVRFSRPGHMPEPNPATLLKVPGLSRNVSTPPTLFHDHATGVRIQPWLNAGTLLDRLKDSGATEWSEITGRVLAAWHARPATSSPMQSADRALTRARGLLDELEAAAIGGSSEIGTFYKQLVALNLTCDPQPVSQLHGDFHPGQLLVSPQTVWVLDTDGMCAGEPAIDLGNFAAQVRFHESRGHLSGGRDILAALVTGYSSVTGCRVPAERIAFWCALGLLELAMKQARRLRPDWRERSAKLLRMANTVADNPQEQVVGS